MRLNYMAAFNDKKNIKLSDVLILHQNFERLVYSHFYWYKYMNWNNCYVLQ